MPSDFRFIKPQIFTTSEILLVISNSLRLIWFYSLILRALIGVLFMSSGWDVNHLMLMIDCSNLIIRLLWVSLKVLLLISGKKFDPEVSSALCFKIPLMLICPQIVIYVLNSLRVLSILMWYYYLPLFINDHVI